ncbi:apolipoprotein N-acyltransferase [Candidatus Binatus sp.]|uniref:apolipoprotein N-acyltransferase n=1 Tax=Candidatus Binatus sp. TaxID=2811406 RepID=UPI003CC6512E
MALALSRSEFSWLAWIALIPLLAVVSRRPLSAVFGYSWLLGLSLFSGTLYWIAFTYHHYADKPYLESVSTVLLLSGIEAIFVAASVGAAIIISRRLRLSVMVALPTTWVAGELIRSVFPIGCPWAFLGYALARDLSIIQISGITGAYGVSWLIVFVNAALFSLTLGGERRNQRITIAISLGACMLAVVGFGIFQLEGARRVVSDKILSVGIVQGGLPQTLHFKRESVPPAFSAYAAATDALSRSHPDLVIWPENAIGFLFQADGFYPDSLTLERKYRSKILELARDDHTPLLFGAPAFYFGNSVSMRDRAYLISAQGQLLNYTDKIELVPFSEYLPARNIIGRFMNPLIPRPFPFTAGHIKQVLYIDNIGLGAVICYEANFPYVSRQLVQAGSEVLINISNDTWFGRSSAPYEILSIDVFRAVENHVPLIRVANSGVSAVISPTGQIKGATPLFVRTSEIESISVGGAGTFYTRHGDLFARTCVGLTALGLLLAVFVAISEKPVDNLSAGRTAAKI